MWPFSRRKRTELVRHFRSRDARLDQETARLADKGWRLDHIETDKYGHVRAHYVRSDTDADATLEDTGI